MTVLQVFFFLSLLACIGFFASGYVVCYLAKKEWYVLESERQLNAVETERSRMEVLLASLRIDYSELHRRHTIDARSHATLEERTITIEKNLDLERGHLKKIKLAYTEAKNHLEEKASALLDLTEERDRAHKMIEQSSRENADLDNDIKQLRAELEASLSAKKSIERSFAQKLDAAQKNQDALDARLRATTIELDHTKDEREKISGEINDLSEQLDVAKTKVADLEKTRDDDSQDPSIAQKEIDELTINIQMAQGELSDLRLKLQITQAKLAEVDRLIEQNRDLRIENTDLQIHREASAALEQLQKEHKQTKIEAELALHRLDELEGKEQELGELRAKAEELVFLTTELAESRMRESALRAKLFSSGRLSTLSTSGPAVGGPAVGGLLPAGSAVGGLAVGGLLSAGPAVGGFAVGGLLSAGLDALVRVKNARAAILADGNGFLVASAGEAHDQEDLAAFTGLVGEMTTRARAFLPLGDLINLRIIDSNAVAISCRFFDSEGTSYALATVDTDLPGTDPAEERTVDLVKSYTSMKTYEDNCSDEHVLESASG